MAGVTALAWTMTGLLATALAILAAALFQSQARTDALRAEITDRTDGLRAEIATRTDGLRADLGADLREIRDAIRSLDRRLTSAGG
ncbi:MAG: hypothetical protein ACRDTP_00165 [Mycobacteriales bacterium]